MTLAQLAILAEASVGRARPRTEEGTFMDMMAFSQGSFGGK